MDDMPQYRINRSNMLRYLAQKGRELKRAGGRGSDREIAAEIGVSHTLISQIKNNRDSSGKPKAYVNMETARLFEIALHVPPGVLFAPVVSPVASDTLKATA